MSELFSLTPEDKVLLQKISSLCGVKQDIIKEVWQFTLFNAYLDILENKDNSYHTISVPFLGKIMVKPNKQDPSELENFVALSENTKSMIRKIKLGAETQLVSFFDENFIKKSLESF